MKKMMRLFMVLTVMCFTTSGFAQTIRDVFNSETPLFYLGIDFTKVRIIDDASQDEIAIRDKQFGAINELIVNEPKKFDIAGAFKRSQIDHDLGPVAARNRKTNAGEILSTNSADFARLKDADITSLVKGFDFGKTKGTGILFVPEAMAKSKKMASIWVVLIDIKTKKILLNERLEVKMPGGLSWRNYYSSAIKSLIDNIDDKKYKEWKQKYS